MALFDDVKDKMKRLAGGARDEHAARQEKSESDITPDPGVAGARDGTEEDGSYVGRTNPQFDADTQQSGAEARSEAEQSDGH